MSRSNGKQVTLVDVAAASGVSHQTVSRVVNQHPHVAEATRERVMRQVSKLGYQPNKAARSLVTNRSNAIGVVSFGATHYGPAQTIVNIERMIRRRGYALITTSIEGMSFGALRQGISNLKLHQVDGIVLMTPICEVELERAAELCDETPFVMLDIELGKSLPSVVIDQKQGARLATQHLIDKGHRHIAELHGPLDWVDAKLRHDGFLETLKLADLTPAATADGDWSAESGFKAALHLLEGQPFSAVFSHNDQMALGALRALHTRGFRIPEDISVVGFDNIPESAFFEPPLTTVQQDFAALGEQSVDYLVGLMSKARPPLHQRVLYPTLVERQSVVLKRVVP